MVDGEEIVEELRHTREVIGEIYPVIKDKKGQIIDGKHRKRAGWKSEKVLKEADTDAKSLLLRLVANKTRRGFEPEEARELANTMGEIALKRGVKPGKIAPALSEVSGYSESWWREHLDEKYKAKTMPKTTEVVPKPPQKAEGATPPPAPKSGEAVEHGKAGAEFGKLGGRPPRYFRVCPGCGFKGKASMFGKISAGE